MQPIAIKDVMTPAPICIDATASISEARQLMSRHQIHHLPVMVGGSVEGILSERCIRHISSTAPNQDSDPLTVADFCQNKAYLADSNDSLHEIVSIMAEQHISEVIILTNGELAGIFTEADCCKLLAALLTKK